MIDRSGIPLAVWISAAKVHDSMLLTALVDAVEPIPPDVAAQHDAVATGEAELDVLTQHPGQSA